MNGENVDALSFVSPTDQAQARGRRAAKRLHKVIKRQQFEIIIQAKVTHVLVRVFVLCVACATGVWREQVLLLRNSKFVFVIRLPQAQYFGSLFPVLSLSLMSCSLLAWEVGVKPLARERIQPFRKDVLIKSGKMVRRPLRTRSHAAYDRAERERTTATASVWDVK